MPRGSRAFGPVLYMRWATTLAFAVILGAPLVAKEPWTVAQPAPVSTKGPHILLVYDMEGMAGQDNIHTAENVHPLYAQGRRLLTDDVNAVIEGLFAGGAKAVSIVDGHGGGNLQDDVLRDEVDRRATLILRTPLDAYRDLARPGMFDGVAAVAMHAKSGSGGFFAHTWTLGIDIAMNGRSMNEVELMGLGYGEAGIPVIFASGDNVLREELRSMPWVEYVTVKEATGPVSAKLYPVPEMRKQLTAGARRAMQRLSEAKIIRASTPVQVAIKAFPPADLSWIEGMPGVNYRDHTVYYEAPDFRAAYQGIQPVGTAAYQAFSNTMLTPVKAHEDAKELELQGVEELLRVWEREEIARAAAASSTPAPDVPTTHAVPLGPLPKTVEPLRYRLELKILPDQDRFSGRTEILLRLKEPSTRIWLHGRDLAVSKVHALDAAGRESRGRYRPADPLGVAEVTFDSELAAGEVRLIFEHEAALRKGGFGSGLSSMKVGDESYVSSLMFSSAARRVFPSFDEPRFKTPYEVSLIVPAEHVAMTNAPEVRTEPMDGGLKRVHFAASKPLPTYLVGFTVGPYDVPSAPALAPTILRQRPVPVRAFGAKGNGPKLRYALDSTAGIVAALEEYLASPYPYEKLDLIAIPDPQERGGMENAAAISYGQYDLLREENSSVRHERDLIYLHAHELAHQWFGDLVTPAWWDDFWINEAFATWLGHRTAATWAPGRDFERVGLRWGLESMVPDSRVDAQEIRPRIRTIADMSAGLNQLMYAKGNAVIAMFEHYVGEGPFRAGVRSYLQRYPFGTANTDGFLAAFEEGALRAAGESPAVRQTQPGILSAAWRSFLDQPGVPQLDVQWRCDGKSIELQVEQSRYVPLGSKVSARQQWQVPFCVSYTDSGKRRSHCELIEGERDTVVAPVKQCPAAVMPNAEGAGFYRFTLTAEKMRALAGKVARLDAREALSLEDSLSAAMMSGRLSLDDYLRVVPAFAAHPAWDVAAAPLPRLSFIIDHLLQDADQEHARAFASQLYSPLMQRVGLANESEYARSHPDEAAQLRFALVPFLALKAREQDLRAELTRIGMAELDDPALFGVALAVAAEEGGNPFAETLWKRLRASKDPIVRQSVVQALGAIKDQSVASWVRNLALNGELSPSEAATLLGRQSESPENVDALWEWKKQHLKALSGRIKGYGQRQLVSLAGGFCSAAAHADVEKDLRASADELPGGVPAIEPTLEQIDHCIAMVGRHRDAARAFFSTRSSTNASRQ